MKRVVWPGAVVALAIASIASAAGKLAIPATGAYLGLWANTALAPSPEKTIEIREGPAPLGIGRTFAMHLVYYHWTDIASQLSAGGVFQPDFTLAGDISHGRVPVISWKCDDTVPNSNHVIAGGDANEDAVITASAKALAQYPGPVMLRWFWEFNQLNKNQSCRGDTGGTPTPQVYADFIGAWQRIWTLFQKAGATNVVFLWNPGSYSAGAPEDPHGYYPGNAYVDWIGVDTYQRSTADSFVIDFGQFYSDFSQSQYANKPIMVGENGSFNYSLNSLEVQAAYLQGVLAAMQANRYPLLKAYDYFDAGGIDTKGNATNWVLDDNNGQGNGGLAAFAALGASALFSPASPTLLPSPDGTTVYDAGNNVSWLADSNLAASNQFGLPLCTHAGTQTCVNASGSMRYDAATAWIQAMNAANYLGHNNWQLPTVPPIDRSCGKTGPNGDSFGFGCMASAFASLYKALGFKSPNTAVPIPNNTVGPFSNLQPYLYWSQSVAPPPSGNLTFSFATGWQGANTAPNFLYVLPMIAGKLPGTPPAAGNGLQVNPGGQTVYDPMTNITWLVNANLAAISLFGLPVCADPITPAICVGADGAMTLASASQFITNMNSGAGYLGQTHWQLPTIDSSCPNYNCAGALNPMGNLFYGQLGFSQGISAIATSNIAVGPFRNIQPYLYWTCGAATIQGACQANGPAPNFEWSFSLGSGFEGTDLLANDLYVTAYFVNPCTYSLSSGGQAFTASGGIGSITITTQAGCPWDVGALPAGVSLSSAGSGFGPGTVTFQVVPNAADAVSTSFTIAGQTFTIEQSAFSIPGLAAAGSLGQVASEGTWDFNLIGINLGTSAATARFTFADNNGNPLTLPLTFPQLVPAAGPLLASTLDRTLNPNAQIVMESTGPDNVATLVGSGQLSTNGNVTGFGIFSNPKVHWNAVVPLETRNASKYILAFDNTSPLTTGLAVANLSLQAANVSVIIRDDMGNLVGNPPPISLGALGHTSFMLNDPQLGYPVTKGKRGTIEFDTPPGGQLSVLGLRANGPALTTLPVLANVGTSGGSIAHVAYNGGWTSVFYIVNTGNAQAQFTLSFFDENGIALPVPLLLPQSATSITTSALTQTLAAGAMVVVDTNQQDSPTAIAGSAQLTTTGNISGFEIFRWNTFNQEASVPLETRTPNSFVLVFDNTNSLTTGVALASTLGLPVNITATFRDDTGVQLGAPQSITLPAHGHTSFLLPNNYAVTAGKRGMVEFAAPQGQNISVIGLRAKSDGTLTTIPVLTK